MNAHYIATALKKISQDIHIMTRLKYLKFVPYGRFLQQL
jgi:hypothetical protein